MSPVHLHHPRSLGRQAVPRRCAGAPALARATALLLAVTACGSDGPQPFDGSAASLELLGEQVLGALTRGDLGALERVRLTGLEHNVVVWPELPASAPEINFPVDFAWSNIQIRNESALRRVRHFYAGRAAGLERVECRGDTEAYRTFELLTDCWVVFTMGESDEVLEAQLFKDVLVRGGGHKIFRYYGEEPRPTDDP